MVDGAGSAFAPVHLGVAAQTFMPFIVRILSLFGPGELRAAPLPRRPVRRGSMTISPRLVSGDVIVERRRWIFPASALPEEIHREKRHAAFAALNRWRIAEGIPARVFVIERIAVEGDTPLGGERYKPQYIDFTSPLFVQIFLSMIGKDPGATVIVEEMIPTPDAALADEEGRSWVVELQLDTLALRAGRTRRSAHGSHER